MIFKFSITQIKYNLLALLTQSHKNMAKKTVTNKKSIAFLEKYLNNASPTGFESEGQKLWLDYIKPL